VKLLQNHALKGAESFVAASSRRARTHSQFSPVLHQNDHDDE